MEAGAEVATRAAAIGDLEEVVGATAEEEALMVVTEEEEVEVAELVDPMEVMTEATEVAVVGMTPVNNKIEIGISSHKESSEEAYKA